MDAGVKACELTHSAAVQYMASFDAVAAVLGKWKNC
jgi:hypothetical protein